MDDVATYALLKSCETTAVFQLESRGMKGPDPAAAAGLLRRHRRAGGAVPPGPLQSGMVDDFIAASTAASAAAIDYLHPGTLSRC